MNYQTVDGTSLPWILPNDQPGFAGVDYEPVSGQLVFDDFEMSKTILIPILYRGTASASPYGRTSPSPLQPGDQTNRVFGIQLIDDSGATSPQLDGLEDSSAVSQPRVDPVFATAEVKILNTDADPWGPDLIAIVHSNVVVTADTNMPPVLTTNIVYHTNYVNAAYPTNNVFGFEKANYRVPADVDDPAISPYNWPMSRSTSCAAERTPRRRRLTITVDSELNDDSTVEEWNNYFPLQPGSDYAVPLPANQNTVIRNYALTNYDRVSTNYDFNVANGTISFPANNGAGFYVQPIHITLPISKATKFNKDFRISLYRMFKVGNDSVPRITGMNAETTVTVLFNDENPPAGSVDEFYNADFNTELAVLPPPPSTTPGDNSNPGVGSPLYPGQVYAIAVLTNDEAFIGGDFPTYDGTAMGGVALVQTNGQLDTSFDPVSGVSGDVTHQGNDARVNAVAISTNQFYIGGNFTAFNNTLVGCFTRVNADGTLDTTFNSTGSGADGTIRAIAVQPDGKVLIGGDFTHFNGTPRFGVARLNTDGSVDTSFDPGTTLSGSVYSLALSQFTIFQMTRTDTNGPNEDVQYINLGSVTSGTLTMSFNSYIFTNIAGIYYGGTNIAVGAGVGLLPTPGGSAINPFYTNNGGTVTLVLPFGPNAYLPTVTTNQLAIVMNQGGSTVAPPIDSWKYTVTVTIPNGQGVVVGGQFSVAGQTYANIARLGTNGTLDATFNPGTGPNGLVHALAWQVNNQIVAGGEFTTVNGLSYNHIARFNADGSIDTTNFFVGAGADDVVYNITLDPSSGVLYVGGVFQSFNGTHRRGFTRLYANGTVDTTFMDTAYNQFAGLKKIYSWDSWVVFASAVQSAAQGNGVLIGGSFLQVGGGQANPDVCNFLDEELYFGGILDSFADPNLWVEPKTRDGVRNRTGFARLIGGSTPGPGNIGLNQTSYSQDKSISTLPVALVRTNGTLGPASANFSVQPQLALAGQDYKYQAAPPLYWIAWNYLHLQSRMREDGLWGVSGNGLLVDALGASLSQADSAVNSLAKVTVGMIANSANPGNLNAQFQLANPSLADTFYLGGEAIPLGTALGRFQRAV